MTNNTDAAIAFALIVAATAVAAALVASNAYADDIAIGKTPFVSDGVSAQLEAPCSGGNPWKTAARATA